ncbi:MAG: hypothetical protein K5912_02715 [Alphaproteobacteria bacterium]|nr:hypothetical protein [Alphaproteobacteria bacterium]
MKKDPFYIIKNRNGEYFAQKIRKFLDIPNIEQIVHFAGRDPEPLLNYLKSLNNIKIKEYTEHNNPINLLNIAGYNAYIADTLKKQNAIKKYFEPTEEICTFKDSHRFETNFIINAVRKNINRIERPEFPKRDDEYGTSVISIQIAKDGNGIIITNRYNHKVLHSDKTFDGDPDNIIPGLSDALKHKFNIDFSSHCILLPKPYILVNNQICKYNQQVENTFFGDDFYVKNNEIIRLDKGYQMHLGNGFILDLHTKTIYNPAHRPDEFGHAIEDTIKNKKIQICKQPDGTKSLIANKRKIFDIQGHQITALNTPCAKQVDLSYKTLTGYLNTEKVGHLFMTHTCVSGVKKILLNPHAYSIYFDNVNGLHGTINMYDVDTITATHSDFSKVKKLILNPNATTIDLSYSTGFHGILNLEHVDNIDLSYADLSNVSELKLNPKAKEINLDGVKGIKGIFDLRDVATLKLMYADISQAKIMCDIKKILFTESNNHR